MNKNNYENSTLIISLNFHPGHFSHLVANYKLYQEMGENPTLFVHPEFSKMDAENRFSKIFSLSDLNEKRISKAIFWFPSLKNIKQLFILKYKYKSKIYYVYHEPFDTISNYRKGGFSYFKIFKIFLINIINLFIVILSDKIFLPSQKSFDIYTSRYHKINTEYVLLPLIFDDEAQSYDLFAQEKKYISYIGTVAEDHAFDEFVKFVLFCDENNYYNELKFLIATKSTIDSNIIYKLRKLVEKGRLKLYYGKPLSNHEINDCFLKSILVWNAYHRSNQSGVLPKSFMFATPVIIQRNNANEFVREGYNAIFINDNSNVNEIKQAIDKIIVNIDEFSQNSRNTFLEKFYFRNYIKYFN